MAANNTWAMTAAGPRAQGAVSGMLNLARNLGHITGASVIVMIFSTVGPMLAGSQESKAASAAIGFQVVLVLAAGLALIAVLVSVRARRADVARAPYLQPTLAE